MSKGKNVSLDIPDAADLKDGFRLTEGALVTVAGLPN